MNKKLHPSILRIDVFIFSAMFALIGPTGCKENPVTSLSVPPGFTVDEFLGTISYDSSMHASKVSCSIWYQYIPDSGSLKHVEFSTGFGGGVSEGIAQYAPDPPNLVKELHYAFGTSAIPDTTHSATIRCTIEGWLIPVGRQDTSFYKLFTWSDSIRVSIH